MTPVVEQEAMSLTAGVMGVIDTAPYHAPTAQPESGQTQPPRDQNYGHAFPVVHVAQESTWLRNVPQVQIGSAAHAHRVAQEST
jgi:hypothetical protein